MVNDLLKAIKLTESALQQAVAAATPKDASTAIDQAWAQTLPLQLTSSNALRAAFGLPGMDSDAIL